MHATVSQQTTVQELWTCSSHSYLRHCGTWKRPRMFLYLAFIAESKFKHYLSDIGVSAVDQLPVHTALLAPRSCSYNGTLSNPDFCSICKGDRSNVGTQSDLTRLSCLSKVESILIYYTWKIPTASCINLPSVQTTFGSKIKRCLWSDWGRSVIHLLAAKPAIQ